MLGDQSAPTIELPKERSIVLWSTPESVASNQISALAFAETIVAVATYWTLAFALGTTIPLLLSISVVPLLLLRSDQSVALGLRWFHEYVDRGVMSLWSSGVSPLKSFRFWYAVLLAAIVDGIATFFLSVWSWKFVPATPSAFVLIGLGIIVGYLGLVCALVFVTAFAIRDLIVVASRIDGAAAVSIALAASAIASGLLARVPIPVLVVFVAVKLGLALLVIRVTPTVLDNAKRFAAREGIENWGQYR